VLEVRASLISLTPGLDTVVAAALSGMIPPDLELYTKKCPKASGITKGVHAMTPKSIFKWSGGLFVVGALYLVTDQESECLDREKDTYYGNTRNFARAVD
jgi:hypothetical protein